MKKNVTKPNKTAGQIALELKEKKLLEAKALIDEQNKKELDKVVSEVNEFIKSIEARGYTLVPAGSFNGNRMSAGIQVARIQ